MGNRHLILLLVGAAVVYFVMKQSASSDPTATVRQAPPNQLYTRPTGTVTPDGTSAALATANDVATLADKFASVIDKGISWFQTNDDGKA